MFAKFAYNLNPGPINFHTRIFRHWALAKRSN